ncbi:flagellar basal body rod protein FlgC [Lacunimicrobium album]
MLKSIDISTSGLIAQRQRMNSIAENLANMNTTRDAEGKLSPFQRRLVTFQQQQTNADQDGRGVGVKVQVDIDQTTPARKVFQPGHPDADKSGYVSMPNINMVTEMVNALEASRAYEANIAAINTSKQMGETTLEILR